MEYVSPPLAQRIISPSPLRATPTKSKAELRKLYPSPPRFLLDALEESPDVPVELPKHFLRDFPFRMEDGHVSPTSKEMDTIASYFPGCFGVGYCPPYLVVSWPQDQVKPWPLTVGGLPLYYATRDRPFPPTYTKGARGVRIMTSAEERLKPWEEPSDVLIAEIATTLVGMGIGLKLFGWCSVRWYAEVVSVTDGMRLPATICGLVVMWEVFTGCGESARTIIPDGHVIDTTSYSPTLRPGVLLESSTGLIGSTSGIPLLGPDGKRWFTVAEHAFKVRGAGAVHHPRFQGGASVIGHVERDIFPGYDIGLVQLKDGFTYSAMSFDGEEVDGTTLIGLVECGNVKSCESVFLDSPYNGRCEGIVTWRGVSINDAIDPEYPQVPLVHMTMMYFGNGANNVLPGTCGSAVWNGDNEVVGFFRWYDEDKAVAYSLSMNAVIEAGFTLEAIP